MAGVTKRVLPGSGAAVAVYDLGGNGRENGDGNGDGGALLLSHATGFHGRCYLPIATALGDRFHSWTFDYRGHGDTAAAEQPVDWDRYGDDAEAVSTDVAADSGPLVGFGHSMGGACLLMTAHRRPQVFQRLVVFEPIVFPPTVSPAASQADNSLAAGARRRRVSFPSFAAASANFASKPPLSAFSPDALDAYVRYGFAEQPDGTVQLKCRPETEASTFETGGNHHTWALLAEITIPVLVVAGRPQETQPSRVAADIAGALPNGSYLQLDHLDHFGPMTAPDEIAEIIATFAAVG